MQRRPRGTLSRFSKVLIKLARIKTPKVREIVLKCVQNYNLIGQMKNSDEEANTNLVISLIGVGYNDQNFYKGLLETYTSDINPQNSEISCKVTGFIAEYFPNVVDWEALEQYFGNLHRQDTSLSRSKSKLINAFAEHNKGSPHFWQLVEESIDFTIKIFEAKSWTSSRHDMGEIDNLTSGFLTLKNGLRFVSHTCQCNVYEFLLRLIDRSDISKSNKMMALLLITKRLPTTKLELLVKAYQLSKGMELQQNLTVMMSSYQNFVWRSRYLLLGRSRDCEEEVFLWLANILVSAFDFMAFKTERYTQATQNLTLTFKHALEMCVDLNSLYQLPPDIMEDFFKFLAQLSEHCHDTFEPEKWVLKDFPDHELLVNPFAITLCNFPHMGIVLLMHPHLLSDRVRESLKQMLTITCTNVKIILEFTREYWLASFAIKEGLLPWGETELQALINGLEKGEFDLFMAENSTRLEKPWQIIVFPKKAQSYIFLNRLIVSAHITREAGRNLQFLGEFDRLYAQCLEEFTTELQKEKLRLNNLYKFYSSKESESVGEAEPAEFSPNGEETAGDRSKQTDHGILLTEWKNWMQSASNLSSWLSGSFSLSALVFQSSRLLQFDDYLEALEDQYNELLIYALMNLDRHYVRSSFCKFVWSNREILQHRLDLITIAAMLPEAQSYASREEWAVLHRRSNRLLRRCFSTCTVDCTYFRRSLAVAAGLGVAILKNGVVNPYCGLGVNPVNSVRRRNKRIRALTKRKFVNRACSISKIITSGKKRFLFVLIDWNGAYCPKRLQFSTSLFESNVTGPQIHSAETLIRSWILTGSSDWVEPDVTVSSFGEQAYQSGKETIKNSLKPLQVKTISELELAASQLHELKIQEWRSQSSVDLLLILSWPRPICDGEKLTQYQNDLGEELGLRLNKFPEDDFQRHLCRVLTLEMRRRKQEKILEPKEPHFHSDQADLKEYLKNCFKIPYGNNPRAYLKKKNRENIFDFDSEINNMVLNGQPHFLDDEIENFHANLIGENKGEESLEQSQQNDQKLTYLWGEMESLQSIQKLVEPKSDLSPVSVTSISPLDKVTEASLQQESLEQKKAEEIESTQLPGTPASKSKKQTPSISDNGWVIGKASKQPKASLAKETAARSEPVFTSLTNSKPKRPKISQNSRSKFLILPNKETRESSLQADAASHDYSIWNLNSKKLETLGVKSALSVQRVTEED